MSNSIIMNFLPLAPETFPELSFFTFNLDYLRQNPDISELTSIISTERRVSYQYYWDLHVISTHVTVSQIPIVSYEKPNC